MRRFVRLAALLYPPGWRRRYGTEFGALIEDAKPSWRDVFDVLGGAIKMQISMWSFRNVTVACGVLGVIIATVWAFSLPNQYVSRAMMRVESPAPGGQPAIADHISKIWLGVISRRSLSELIQRPGLDLYKSERREKPLEDVIENMKDKDIRIELLGDRPRVNGTSGAAFLVSFRYPDRFVAQQVTSALITKLMDANQIAARRNPVPNTSARLDLLDPASLPQNPTSPNRWQMILLGLVLGVMAGILTFGARRWPLVAVSGFAGLVLAGVASFLIPSVWVSRAVLRIGDPQQLANLANKVMSDDFLKSMVERENLYQSSRGNRSMDEVIQNMRSRDLRIDVIGRDSNAQPTAIVISYRNTDRAKTPIVVNRIIDALSRANMEDASTAPKATLELLDPASLPETPVAPNRPEIAGTGMGLGLLGGLIVMWIRRVTRGRPSPSLQAAQS